MGTSESSPFFLFSLVSIFCMATSTEICSSSACGENEPAIRFPFRLINGRQPKRCGYPGFDLITCNSLGKTILSLPSSSGKFNVKFIDYAKQEILINDLDNCLPRQLLHLNLSSSPFSSDVSLHGNLAFLNCSSEFTRRHRLRPITCLSSSAHAVLATSSKSLARSLYSNCSVISIVSVPTHWPVYKPDLSSEFKDDLALTWVAPKCGRCEARGGICGFKSNSSLEIRCSDVSRRGLPRTAKYAVTIGVVVPALVGLVAMACHVCGWVKARGVRRRLNAEPVYLSTVAPQPTIIVGLDAPTIESYPTLVVGESRQLPKPNESTCPICLSEYRAKETLRTIPECQHCFHADCVDEWLRMNATCPVCRISPGRLSADDAI